MEYKLFPLPSAEQFPALINDHPEITGLNVTIPYKEQIIPYLDELDETAASVGAVNVIKVERHEESLSTIGYNTDSKAFLDTLRDLPAGGQALILGTGGAAKAVACALSQKNIPYRFVSREKSGANVIQYHDLTREVIHHHRFIINTTPLGMFPQVGLFPPIPYRYLDSNHLLYDLVYNPVETVFLKRGREMNALTINGSGMLLRQAELTYNIFLNPI